jgi:hypothetical protein
MEFKMTCNNGVDEPGSPGPFIFSLNPLISEIALWNEAEILDARPEFTVLDRATRVAEICKQLLLNGLPPVRTVLLG